MSETESRWKGIRDKLASDDAAMIVERQVNQLERDCLEQLNCGVECLAYDPLKLFKMVLYQFLKGRRSPAKWFEEAKLNESMQWLDRG